MALPNVNTLLQQLIFRLETLVVIMVVVEIVNTGCTFGWMGDAEEKFISDNSLTFCFYVNTQLFEYIFAIDILPVGSSEAFTRQAEKLCNLQSH